MKRWMALALFAGAALAGPASREVREAVEPGDSVTTLALSHEIVSRGRLGGVAVDRLGYVYVSNFHEGAWRIDPDGQTTKLTSALYGSSGNTINNQGDLLQSNFFANTITRISRTGEVETVVSKGLKGPVGLAVDRQDNLYVCNCSGNNIAKVTGDGSVSTFVSGEFLECPNGITIDSSGDIFVVNFSNGHIIRITPSGEARVFTTLPRGGNAHIVLSRGYFYVTKAITNQVYRVAPDGKFQVLVGASGKLGLDDGPASQATMAVPNGIAVDPTGRLLYVNNLKGLWRGNQKTEIVIRRIELASIEDVLTAALAEGGVEALRQAHARYKSDPMKAHENTRAAVRTMGFKLLSARDIGSALTLFQLNTESYPDSASFTVLGNAYRIIGQKPQAIEAYSRALELNPENTAAKARLRELREN